MYATKTISIYGVSDGIAYCEAMGLGRCLIAYAENASREDIMQIGFNENSGYTYIALENGISICSMLGRDVEFMRDNPEDGEELFFDSYAEAEAHNFDNDSTNNGGIN